MEKRTRNLLLTFLYLLALYLGVKLLPTSSWVKEEYQAKLISLAFLGVVFVLCVYEIRKSKVSEFKNPDHPSYFLLLPLIVSSASNLLYVWIFGVSSTSGYDPLLFLDIVLTLFSVAIEETLFRFFFLAFLLDVVPQRKDKNFLVVLFSSLAFSLMHAINFYGNNPFNVLIQMGYTFILGMILGSLVFLYGGIYLPMLGHFLFNGLNMNVFSSFYSVDMSNASYLLFSLGIVLFTLVYLFLLYYLAKKKEEKNHGQ